jgi:cytochrome c biogenesis protein CcdA
VFCPTSSQPFAAFGMTALKPNMWNLTKNRAFIAGFTICILLLLCLNAFIFLRSHCHHCVRVAGIPFIFWAQFMGNPSFTPSGGMKDNPNDFEYFLFFNLIADILITIGFSFLIGLLFKFVWSKIVSRLSRKNLP